MKVVIIITVLAVAAGGVYMFLGKGSTELGNGIPAGAQIVDISGISEEMVGEEITIRGAMSQKCPTAGCWFYLKDSTGEIRVDTAPSGFTITEIPLGKEVTVHGKVVRMEGGLELVALGVKS